MIADKTGEMSMEDEFELEMRKYLEEEEKKKEKMEEININRLHKLKENKEMDKCLWTVKYAPITSNNIIGNKANVEKIKNWLNNWEFNNNRQCKYNPYEYKEDEDRDINEICKI